MNVTKLMVIQIQQMVLLEQMIWWSLKSNICIRMQVTNAASVYFYSCAAKPTKKITFRRSGSLYLPSHFTRVYIISYLSYLPMVRGSMPAPSAGDDKMECHGLGSSEDSIMIDVDISPSNPYYL